MTFTLRAKTVQVGPPMGLHPRPAAVISEAAQQFEEEIYLTLVGASDDDDTDATSTLMIMALGAQAGDSITVCSENQEAVDRIASLIESNLESLP